MKYKILSVALLSCALLAPTLNFAAEKAVTTTEHHSNASKSDLTSTVDINQADAKTLTTLKDIGPKKADAIIAYRTKNGDFKAVDELLQVPGISKRILKDNENRITLG